MPGSHAGTCPYAVKIPPGTVLGVSTHISRILAITLTSMLSLAACRGRSPNDVASPAPSASPTAPASTPSPTTAAPTVGAPGLLVVGTEGAGLASAPNAPASRRLRRGVIVPFDSVQDGWARVMTPCENRAWMRLTDGVPQPAATAVIDPGHGGDELGAVGPGGLPEKEVNLEVARGAAAALRSEGVETVLTRADDYRATLAFRVTLAAAAGAKTLVSIHHNADPDGPAERPGTETFYQYRSPASKRLAGLVYEEGVAALAGFSAQWVGDRDAGAKWRLNSRGDDYYGVLRRAGQEGITATLAEMLFISNPSEEALLRREDTRAAEAQALSGAVLRFLRTGDPGSGFTTPYPRTAPAGPGGGRAGCVDPS